jgi:predicted RNA binding protein YcfA (HicA-like mRNA interferase family)
MQRRRHRRRARQITAVEARKLLEQAKFDLVRSGGGHKIFQRGETKLTLPSSGTCGAWLTQLIYKQLGEEEP